MMPLVLFAGLASATVTFTPVPIVGQATVVEVLDADQHPRSGETVRVLHRPGLAGEEEQAIGITDGRGRVSWTPSSPGVAVVRAGEEREAVHIATTTPRLDTWLLLVLLGLAGASSLAISTWKRP